jgi:two-component system CheB/CheR fusion protein
MKKILSPSSKENDFVPIVAIGGSAGGVEAISELLKSLSPSTGMAYVYIQHQNPEHESKLVNVLSRITTMQVLQPKNGEKIKANHLYIIPPDKEITIKSGAIKLEDRVSKSIQYSIDHFFISLANTQKQGIIGILLSGASTDGTMGLKAIKASNGFTYTQDESAQFQSMPQSAVAEGVVDRVMSPAELAGELERLSQRSNIIKLVSSEDDIPLPDDSDFIHNDDEDLIQVINLIKRVVGVDFIYYKRNTIKRRIVRRMLLHRLQTLKDYLSYLKENQSEINLLYNDLLINVTCFFRDPDATEFLKKTILPRIVKSKPSNEPIRIWIPACSSGEEAYSMAILLMEVLGTKATTTPIQIFATDLSEGSINKARLGLYTKNDLADMSPKRVQRFFNKVEGGYRVIKPIRDVCIFAPHNVFKDPPFSRLDLISCCNLFIYLEPMLQKKVLATFHYALNPNGYLMLGKSEALGASGHLFTQLEKKYKLYTRKEANSKAIFDMNYRISEQPLKESLKEKKQVIKATEKTTDLDQHVDALLFSRFIPPSVVVNQEMEILQFRGATGLFLEPSPGKASLNLLKMVRSSLAFDLRSIIHKAHKTGQPVKKTGLEIKHKGGVHFASIEAIPLKQDHEERLFLIVFEEIKQSDAVENKNNFSKDKLVKQLQDELMALREDLRSIVEDQEASNEELQSANEEIVSSNEELQSINEELETSKEEVESSNEELMTINQELQIRNDQLAESYEYAEAVFDTIRESTLILDHNLRVKNANNAFYKTFQQNAEETEGRLIYEMGNRQWDIPALRKLLDSPLLDEASLNTLEICHSFQEIGEKVLILNVRKIIQKMHHQELILIAIEDITEHKKAEHIIAEREAWFRNVADSSPAMIWISDTHKKFTFFNKTWTNYTGRSIEQERGDGWIQNVHPDDREKCIDVYAHHFNEKLPFEQEYRLRAENGDYNWVVCHGKPTFDHTGTFTGYIGSVVNIHSQKVFSEELEAHVKQRTKALKDANSNLERSNEELAQFAYVASHDLQEPLRKIITFSDRIQQRYKEQLPEEGAVYLDKVTASAARMRKLIEDLLNFSKVTKQREAMQRVELDPIVKEVLSNLELQIQKQNIKVTVSGLPTIHAAPVQMMQLFLNLIGNAIKFASQVRKPEISITGRLLTPTEVSLFPSLKPSVTYYEIVVSDNGIGFNQEFAEQIFIIFQRLNDKKNYPGTGIGLALCKRIVSYHNGLIYAESKENMGASFYIILPFSDQHA